MVKVGSNPEFPDTKCFVIERVDGTEVDFSYIKCVASLYPETYPLSQTLFLTPTRPRCVANLYPEASEGGKGGGQRKGDRKRKAEAAADADTG